MPRVPLYDGPQVTPGTLPQARVTPGDTPDIAGRQAQETGRMIAAGGRDLAQVAIGMQDEANQLRLKDAMNRAKALELRRTYDPNEGFLHLRGEDALKRPENKSLEDEQTGALQKSLDAIEADLGNDAQKRAFRDASGSLVEQFRGRVMSHVAQQYVDYSAGVQQGTIRVAQEQMGLSWADPEAIKQSTHAISAAVYAEGKIRGWSAQQTDAAIREQLGKGHAAVVLSAVTAGRTTYATDYLKTYGSEIDAATRLRLQNEVRQVADVQRGESAADTVWQAAGPKTVNDPVNIFAMEQQIRAQYKDDPSAMKAGIDAVRQRAQAWNAQQNEVNASNINTVYGLLDGGTGLNSVRKSAAWRALPETKQHEILKAMEAEAMTREQRAWYASGRDVQMLQRKELELKLKTGAAYLTYSDPEVLTQMTPEQVRALRPVLGQDQTEQLLRKKEALNQPRGRIEAKMDADDFNAVASEMGFDPFKKNATATERGQIGALRFRIEQLIDAAQTGKGGALSRDEKLTLVREEMARTVTVDPGLFSRNREVPVIALDAKQIRNVVVPSADRQQIIKALQEKYRQNPGNPLFAPTEANVRRLYLQNRSRAGALLPADDGK